MKFLILLVSFFASAVAMACPSDQLCEGDRIIDSTNYVGRTIEVFNNGKAKVLFDGYGSYSMRSIDELGKGVSCNKNICAGDRIIDDAGYVGKAVEVFDSGKAKVLFDGYGSYSIRKTSDLGKGFRCIENLCVGNRIVDNSNYVGRTVEVFDNGQVKVLFDGYGSYSIRSFNSLGIELNCRLRDNCSCRN